MSKWVMFFLIVVVGGFAKGFIDGLLGIDLSNYSDWQVLGHSVATQIQGAAIFWCLFYYMERQET